MIFESEYKKLFYYKAANLLVLKMSDCLQLPFWYKALTNHSEVGILGV
jgi:hypothetical protein